MTAANQKIDGELRKIEIGPNDRLVVRLKDNISNEAARLIKAGVSEWSGLPPSRVLVLGGGAVLGALSMEPSETPGAGAVAIFSRPECVFMYCPQPDICRRGIEFCQNATGDRAPRTAAGERG